MPMHKNIRMYRRAAGLTQRKLGRLVGVEQCTICKWERDGTPPTDAEARAIAICIDTITDHYTTLVRRAPRTSRGNHHQNGERK